MIAPLPRLPDDDARWAAFQNRDRRADGMFLVGVMTTGVYCRPSCSGRPKRENVRFFAEIVDACAAGLRPCKRCRPDDHLGSASASSASRNPPGGRMS
ncbi:MAG TPA: Ada metal-binding domain-containing protein [Rhabdaerophilum sp.]|nr:Ada metal-binding domain-containing protein [Rhabdaerophilum sp.]